MSKFLPGWRVIDASAGSDFDAAKVIYAISPDDAAEEWAEQEDDSTGDYRIARLGVAVVAVRAEESGEITYWRVEGEFVPVYTANQTVPVGHPPLRPIPFFPGRENF